jgi:serine/threonine-protein kinase
MLGRGGQGEVWLAEDTLGGGVVAIKILRSETVSDATYLKGLLLSEARLQVKLSSVQHPHAHIVCIVDVRRLEDDIGIVMEYVEGGSVLDQLGPRNVRKTLPVPQALDIALHTCEALVTAHSVGVIHRDIKPGNILYRKADGVSKVADWGIAKNIDIAGQGKTFTGTPQYMAEEVILLKRKSPVQIMRSEGVDGRADVYSLGVTMYEMLTAALPFDSENSALAGAGSEQENVLLRAGVEPGLAAIVLKAMALKKTDRHQSAAELRDAIHKWQSRHLISEDVAEAWALYNNRHDAGAAERKLQEILRRYPDDPVAYVEMAQFYNQCSREDDAIGVLSKGVEVAPGYARLWNMRGRLYAKRNSPLAVADLRRALTLDLPATEVRHVRRMLNRIETEQQLNSPGGGTGMA